MTEGYAKTVCDLLASKLLAAPSGDDARAAATLNSTAKEIREALITLGLRSRKVRKTPEQRAEATKLLALKQKRQEAIAAAISAIDKAANTQKGKK